MFTHESMRKLTIPEKLAEDFQTIEVVYHSSGSTRRVDALLLAWIKYEKQLRKLFCFFVYQHPNVTRANITEIMDAMATNRDLNPTTLEACILALGVTPVPMLVGNRHASLKKEIDRIKKYRNKLMHGQISGQSIRSAQLERDLIWIIDWMRSLADGADQAFGYDGLRRNTFFHAKQQSVVVQNFPFNDGKTFDAWLKAQTRPMVAAAI